MRIHGAVPPSAFHAPLAGSGGGPVDRVEPGGPAGVSSGDALRKLLYADTERARHVFHSFAIGDIQHEGDTFFPPPEPVLTPHGLLVVGTNRGTIRAFDPARRKELWTFETGVTSAYNTPVAAPDGRLLVSNHRDPELLCLSSAGAAEFRVKLPG
ncbi:MAG: hypothetical protein AB1758_23420, partial [Candidatus Eremiobacterota bacterium]